MPQSILSILSSGRRRLLNRRRNPPTQDQPDHSIDTLTEGINRLTITRDPLLSFDAADESLRLTRTSSTGTVTLSSNRRRGNILRTWKLTGWPGKVDKKTLSVLIMGHNIAPKAAKSGWAKGFNQDEANDIYSPINGSTYTEKTWHLCRLLRCGLKVNKAIDLIDRPGYFEASHAEMHLITWFVETYFPRLLEDGSTARRVGLPQSLDNILIISNRKPYPSCLRLAERVQELTGVAIMIEYRVTM